MMKKNDLLYLIILIYASSCTNLRSVDILAEGAAWKHVYSASTNLYEISDGSFELHYSDYTKLFKHKWFHHGIVFYQIGYEYRGNVTNDFPERTFSVYVYPDQQQIWIENNYIEIEF